jgi:hypothetical protein
MSAQFTLTRSSSLVSTTSTLIGSKKEAKSSKLSLAPSLNGLVDLEKQALATSVPTVGVLEKFAGAKKAIASTAQKAASMLSKPKAAKIKEPKTAMPELEQSISFVDVESQLPTQTSVPSRNFFADTYLTPGGLSGATVGVIAPVTGLLGAYANIGPLTVSALGFQGCAVVAIGAIAGGLFGTLTGGTIQAKLEGRDTMFSWPV